MTVDIRLLGEVEVLFGGRRVDIGHARQQCVLIALLVGIGRVVPVDVLLERVWAGRPPQRRHNALSAYVSRLRRVLATTDEVVITRRSGGYLLMADPMTVDLFRFRRLVEEARSAGDDTEAMRLYGRALTQWRGEAFATLDTPGLVEVRASLDTERLAAQLDSTDVALRLGRHTTLPGELTALAAAHPLDERLTGQLMLALYRCGRQTEALRRFERLRRTSRRSWAPTLVPRCGSCTARSSPRTRPWPLRLRPWRRATWPWSRASSWVGRHTSDSRGRRRSHSSPRPTPHVHSPWMTLSGSRRRRTCSAVAKMRCGCCGGSTWHMPKPGRLDRRCAADTGCARHWRSMVSSLRPGPGWLGLGSLLR